MAPFIFIPSTHLEALYLPSSLLWALDSGEAGYKISAISVSGHSDRQCSFHSFLLNWPNYIGLVSWLDFHPPTHPFLQEFCFLIYTLLVKFNLSIFWRTLPVTEYSGIYLIMSKQKIKLLRNNYRHLGEEHCAKNHALHWMCHIAPGAAFCF